MVSSLHQPKTTLSHSQGLGLSLRPSVQTVVPFLTKACTTASNVGISLLLMTAKKVLPMSKPLLRARQDCRNTGFVLALCLSCLSVSNVCGLSCLSVSLSLVRNISAFLASGRLLKLSCSPLDVIANRNNRKN